MKAELITYMGDDTMVVNAARVSFDNHHEKFVRGEDDRLIRFLAKNDHWTPFAHPQAQFRITVPIFIANQLKRHQIGFALNEVSRRYVDSEPTFERIKEWRGRPTDGAKQGSSGPIEDPDTIDLLQRIENGAIEAGRNAYNHLLREGVAPEQARAVLPQSMHTSWYWTGSLYAWARLCRQRLDAHAQKENQDFSSDISAEMNLRFPVSWYELVLRRISKSTASGDGDTKKPSK